VAKGTIVNWPVAGASCAAPTAAYGFTLTAQYPRGEAGNQDTELDGQGNWVHTNIFADGGLTATYWNTGTAAAPAPQLSYGYNDWLGTKRMQTGSSGDLQTYWLSDPFGDYLTPVSTGGDAAEINFTGKERDT
jgi:hypothetical protein